MIPDSLQNSALGKYLNDQELKMLLTYSNIVSFSAGETILQQGKKSTGIYIVIEGVVIATAKILGEGTTNLETFGPCSFFF